MCYNAGVGRQSACRKSRVVSKKGLIVGQSGGATAVINASLAGVIAGAVANPEVGDILGMIEGVRGLLEWDTPRVIDLRAQAGNAAALDALARTPAAALGMCRLKPSDTQIERLLAILEKLNIGYFCYIGGNDSADTSHRLAMLAAQAGSGLRVIGVPKTIDNDLPEMDHCPGYGSIARYLAVSTQDSGIDTASSASVHPIKIIEVMGRNAGWVAAATALGKRREEDAPHLIYTPELPLDPQRFVADARAAYQEYGYCVAVVGETVKGAGGQPLSQNAEPFFVDSFGHKYYSGPASYLTGLVLKELGINARFDKPGTLQRMSGLLTSEVDRQEAFEAGRVAANMAREGQTDRMVTLLRADGTEYRCSYGSCDLATIANYERKMPEGYLNANGNFVTPAFLDYARPLIGGALSTDDYFHFQK